MLPAEIVLHSSWWFHREGITFDEDFYFHPLKRVESEHQMERALYERWGKFGLGQDYRRERPEVGPVHLAAGYIISAMLGCDLEFPPDAPPVVHCANKENREIDIGAAFNSPIYKRYTCLLEALKGKYSSLSGDPVRTGVCCINIGNEVSDDKITTILETVSEPRAEYSRHSLSP
jgi:hypothetical protein